MKKLAQILAFVAALGTAQVAHAEDATTPPPTTSCTQTTTTTTTPTTPPTGTVSLMSDGGPCPKC